MPYKWRKISASKYQLRVWPHRSLSRKGYVWFVGATAILFGLPMLGVLGSPVLWGLLPFVVLTIWLLTVALNRSYDAGRINEVLTIDRGVARLIRTDPGHETREWQGNPYWLRVGLRHDGPVEDYLTLEGGGDGSGRIVELGAFLSPEERVSLAADLRSVLDEMKSVAGK